MSDRNALFKRLCDLKVRAPRFCRDRGVPLMLERAFELRHGSRIIWLAPTRWSRDRNSLQAIEFATRLRPLNCTLSPLKSQRGRSATSVGLEQSLLALGSSFELPWMSPYHRTAINSRRKSATTPRIALTHDRNASMFDSRIFLCILIQKTKASISHDLVSWNA
jgi:hypothetical protein